MGLENLFTQWQEVGIFSIALPFLLIFAILLGILTKINIFGTKDNENKQINAIIALVVSIISIQFNFVSPFFSDIFPRFGIALAILLVILLLLGLFSDLDNKKNKLVLGGIVVIILIAVLWVPLSNLGFSLDFNGFFEKNFGIIFFLLMVTGVIVWATFGGDGNKKEESNTKK